MFVKKIINSISNYKAMKREALINNFVKIHDYNTTYGTSSKQLYEARKTLANYAIYKGVSIDIYDARRLSKDDEYVSPMIEENLSDKLLVKITDLLNNKTKEKLVSARTDKTFTYVKPNYIVINDPQEGTQYTRLTKLEYEDNFLRHFYRNIESMVNELQK